ncbi:MAG: DUF4231 domain-containing protein [bacterium]|nr:DUF4231 domain-containing protein [bacterium]
MREVQESVYLYEDLSDEKMKKRIMNSLNWFIKKAVVYKRCYYTFSSASIVTPLAMTIMNSVESSTFIANNFKQYSAVLATITTVASSLLALFRFKDQWQEYRTTAEVLKSELIKFQTKTGEYKDQDPQMLCDRIEAIIAQSHINQMKIIDQEDQQAE